MLWTYTWVRLLDGGWTYNRFTWYRYAHVWLIKNFYVVSWIGAEIKVKLKDEIILFNSGGGMRLIITVAHLNMHAETLHLLQFRKELNNLNKLLRIIWNDSFYFRYIVLKIFINLVVLKHLLYKLFNNSPRLIYFKRNSFFL